MQHAGNGLEITYYNIFFHPALIKKLIKLLYYKQY